MILLDSNIIIDLLSSSQTIETGWSRRQYARLYGQPLVANLVVFAEVSVGAIDPGKLASDFDQLEVELLPLTIEASLAAGQVHAAYRRRGGVRQSILADFLIAGHAATLGATLVTRDRRLAAYFPDLPLITPETHPHD